MRRVFVIARKAERVPPLLRPAPDAQPTCLWQPRRILFCQPGVRFSSIFAERKRPHRV